MKKKSEEFFEWFCTSRMYSSHLLPWQATFIKEYLDSNNREVVFARMPHACGRTFVMEALSEFEKRAA